MSNTDSVTGDVKLPDSVMTSDSQNDPSTESTTGAAVPAHETDMTDVAVDAAESSEHAAANEDPSPSEDAGTSVGFEELGLPSEVLGAVKSVGFETPSAIQEKTIPVLMRGDDVVGLAQTGTGKTAAFALPILARIDVERRSPQALILAPTRELALQVADAFQSFADHLGPINVLPIYGGQSYGVQLSGLRRGAHIVVGTPGRVIDHLEKGSLDISGLKYLVLDEADEMLQMGFQEDVERILADTPDEKQVALFSATMPRAIRAISQQYLRDPHEITVRAASRTATNILQRYLVVAHRNKLDALTRILEVTEFEAMIMFVRTKFETEELAEKLRARGFSAAAINGDIPQTQRERTVEQLRDGRLDILVATDVAARGLDVERISHVVNYDVPHDTESYVHRIGRTGRAGRSGEAILFVTPREKRILRTIERATRADLEKMDLPTVDEVNETRKARFTDSITEALEDPQVSLFRSLVKAYSEKHDVPMSDIAAALATQAQAGNEFLMQEQDLDRRPSRRDRDDDRRDRGGRDRFDRRDKRNSDRGDYAVYKIEVGHEHNVRPGAIVGALANEGGLDSRDFGRITINYKFSLVELPPDLPQEVFDRLRDTRVAGQLINLHPDRHGGGRDRDRDRGGRGRGYDRRDRDRDGGYRRRYRDRDDNGGRGRYRDRDRGDVRGGRDRDRNRDRDDRYGRRDRDRDNRRDRGDRRDSE